jgi:hypothetical protein
MDINSVATAGGTSSVLCLIVIIIYKFCTSSHRITSSCCKNKIVDIQTEAPDTPEKNQPIVEDAKDQTN